MFDNTRIKRLERRVEWLEKSKTPMYHYYNSRVDIWGSKISMQNVINKILEHLKLKVKTEFEKERDIILKKNK